MGDEKVTVSGRELLEALARNVSELCTMVKSWREELDRLRTRIDAIEKRERAE